MSQLKGYIFATNCRFKLLFFYLNKDPFTLVGPNGPPPLHARKYA